MGIGLGIGYITPVKTLMLWFADNKGLGTGISIMGFGLAKAIASPIMNSLQVSVGLPNKFPSTKHSCFHIAGWLKYILCTYDNTSRNN